MICTKPSTADSGWVQRTLKRLGRHNVVANITGINTLRPTISVKINSFNGFPALDAACRTRFAHYMIDGDATSGILTIYQNNEYQGKAKDWANAVSKEASEITKKLGLSLKAPHIEMSEKPYSVSYEYSVRRSGRGV